MSDAHVAVTDGTDVSADGAPLMLRAHGLEAVREGQGRRRRNTAFFVTQRLSECARCYIEHRVSHYEALTMIGVSDDLLKKVTPSQRWRDQ